MKPAFVLDASVALSWMFEDEKNAYAERILDSLAEKSAAVSDLWALEVANALMVAERRKRLTAKASEECLLLLSTLDIQSYPTPMGAVFSHLHRVARTHGLSVYDANYLYLAQHLRLPIATLDKQLRAAARHSNIPLAKP